MLPFCFSLDNSETSRIQDFVDWLETNLMGVRFLVFLIHHCFFCLWYPCFFFFFGVHSKVIIVFIPKNIRCFLEKIFLLVANFCFFWV